MVHGNGERRESAQGSARQREAARGSAVHAIPPTAVALYIDEPMVGSRCAPSQWDLFPTRLTSGWARDGADADRGEVAGGI